MEIKEISIFSLLHRPITQRHEVKLSQPDLYLEIFEQNPNKPAISDRPRAHAKQANASNFD
ncbi:hypothetical protein [Pseudohongiella acticola]|uniref:hypothetical protein n=1 Tax=Pseudohongiella acticola TaxID=1524254 RepID=UPI0011131AEE|nr:hypothetical protein [Pseudohongiella acticola]